MIAVKSDSWSISDEQSRDYRTRPDDVFETQSTFTWMTMGVISHGNVTKQSLTTPTTTKLEGIPNGSTCDLTWSCESSDSHSINQLDSHSYSVSNAINSNLTHKPVSNPLCKEVILQSLERENIVLKSISQLHHTSSWNPNIYVVDRDSSSVEGETTAPGYMKSQRPAAIILQSLFNVPYSLMKEYSMIMMRCINAYGFEALAYWRIYSKIQKFYTKHGKVYQKLLKGTRPTIGNTSIEFLNHPRHKTIHDNYSDVASCISADTIAISDSELDAKDRVGNAPSRAPVSELQGGYPSQDSASEDEYPGNHSTGILTSMKKFLKKYTVTQDPSRSRDATMIINEAWRCWALRRCIRPTLGIYSPAGSKESELRFQIIGGSVIDVEGANRFLTTDLFLDRIPQERYSRLGGIPEYELKVHAAMLVLALDALHQEGIIHGNVSFETVIFVKNEITGCYYPNLFEFECADVLDESTDKDDAVFLIKTLDDWRGLAELLTVLLSRSLKVSVEDLLKIHNPALISQDCQVFLSALYHVDTPCLSDGLALLMHDWLLDVSWSGLIRGIK